MLGPAGLGAFAVAILVRSHAGRGRCSSAGWRRAALYAFAVVTVERVDYYLYLVLPLAALWTGGALARG